MIVIIVTLKKKKKKRHDDNTQTCKQWYHQDAQTSSIGTFGILWCMWYIPQCHLKCPKMARHCNEPDKNLKRKHLPRLVRVVQHFRQFPHTTNLSAMRSMKKAQPCWNVGHKHNEKAKKTTLKKKKKKLAHNSSINEEHNRDSCHCEVGGPMK